MTVWLILLAMYMTAMIYGLILLVRLISNKFTVTRRPGWEQARIDLLEKIEHNNMVKGDH